MAKLWLRDKLPNGRTATFFNMIDYNRTHPKAFERDLYVLIEHQKAAAGHRRRIPP